MSGHRSAGRVPVCENPITIHKPSPPKSKPADTTALAGCLEAATAGRIDSGAVVICLVTGSGFKDEASVDRMLDGVECPTLTLDDLG